MTKGNKTEKSVEEVLLDLTGELLELMSTSSKAKVNFNKEADCYEVTIEAGDETGLLIGKKGETLTSLQTMLGLLLKYKTGEWYRIVVNVGDYREKEEDYLKNLGLSAAARAKETGEQQNLYNLNSAQRRIIHMILAEESGIVTESEGEGAERFLSVKPKN